MGMTSGRHRSPRLPPISVEQEIIDQINQIAERVNLPVSWVVRKLLVEALEQVDIETLPVNLMAPRRLEKK